MEKISELYLGDSGRMLISDSKSPEYSGFDAQGAKVLGENLFKFAKLDQIPDEHVEGILRIETKVNRSIIIRGAIAYRPYRAKEEKGILFYKHIVPTGLSEEWTRYEVIGCG